MNWFRNRQGRLVLGLAAVAMGIIALRLTDREPRFEGRALSAWLDDPSLSASEIERGVRAIGTNAIPQLQNWLIQKPSLLERAVRNVDARLDFIGIGYHPSLDANFRGMRGFLVLGELAAPAVPWLEARAARRDADFEFYLKTLLLCGPAGWKAFEWLETTNPNASQSILNALAFGSNQSREITLRLALYLEHPDPRTRRQAYETVRLLRERCPPELLAALRLRAEREADVELKKLAGLFAAELEKDLAEETSSRPSPGD